MGDRLPTVGVFGAVILRPFHRHNGALGGGSGGATVFKVGDKVVYPHHGAAVVERRETKVAFGEKREYLVSAWPTAT